MFHQTNPYICLYAKCGQMRTNQSSDIDKHGQYRKSNRTPSISRQIFCICIIWCHVEHLFDYAPDKIEWNKCNKCTYRSKNPGCNGKIFILSGINKYPLHRTLLCFFLLCHLRKPPLNTVRGT